MKDLIVHILVACTVIAMVSPVETPVAQGLASVASLEDLLSKSAPQLGNLEQRAEKAFLENRFSEAVSLYSQAIRLAPKQSSLYLARGMSYEMVRRPKKAVKDYRKAIGLDPGNYRAMENLAGMYEREEKTVLNAIALYKSALRLDPRPEWKENLQVWIKMLESRQRPEDSSHLTLWQKGNELAAKGKNLEALPLYTQAININPLFYVSYYSRGMSRLATGDLKGALADFDIAADFSPELRGALVQRGLIHERLGNKDRASADFKRASQADSRDPSAHYHLGRMLAQQGHYMEAYESYQEALRWKPKPKLRIEIRLRMAAITGPVRLAMKQRTRIRMILKDLW
jgi:tetratricopeptide (TPR) repeat protein